ncbi:MAG: proline--tRNA ligase [Phycisphaerales bacterium]
MSAKSIESSGTHASEPAISTVRRGEIQRWSGTLIPTAKQPPSDAEAISHQLLARAGFIKRVSAGVYEYLPLGYRTLRKVEAIVRREMNRAGASELLMPAIAPTELLKETGRADDYGDLLFRFEDRHGRDTYLGPTHEEVITDLMRGVVSSYKQLPLNLYQVQTKYRDEFRPRAGLLRCREFLMKDAYSFHMGVEGPGGLNETYDAMYAAYTAIFRACGLDFTVVEAEAGPIGGSASHEFMVNAESGEDTILICPATGYAANVEKCEIGAVKAPSAGWFAGEPSGALEEVHTPGCPGIEDVVKFLKVKPANMLKTVVFKVDSTPADLEKYGEEWVIAVVRGDHEVNEGKVRDIAQCKLKLADPDEARAKGFEIGFVSPRAAVGKAGVLMIVDYDAAVGTDDAKGKPQFWVTGGDKKDFHVKHFNWQRDLGKDPVAAMGAGDKFFEVAQIRNAMPGDPSPKAEGVSLEARRGIEVGHIFKLGTKYSSAMGFEILNEKQERQPVIMGCYGIGVSRTVASCVEQSHDDNGIIWPAAIAPFHVVITPMDVDPTSEAMRVACELSGRLADAGCDVLVDDRDERPGVKFKDADLIGVPVRITIGDKALAEQSVEFKARRDSGKGELVKIDAVVERAVGVLNG